MLLDTYYSLNHACIIGRCLSINKPDLSRFVYVAEKHFIIVTVSKLELGQWEGVDKSTNVTRFDKTRLPHTSNFNRFENS